MDNNRFNQTTGSIGSRFLGSDPTQRLNWTVGFLGMWKRHRAELGAFTFTSCTAAADSTVFLEVPPLVGVPLNDRIMKEPPGPLQTDL